MKYEIVDFLLNKWEKNYSKNYWLKSLPVRSACKRCKRPKPRSLPCGCAPDQSIVRGPCTGCFSTCPARKYFCFQSTSRTFRSWNNSCRSLTVSDSLCRRLECFPTLCSWSVGLIFFSFVIKIIIICLFKKWMILRLFSLKVVDGRLQCNGVPLGEIHLAYTLVNAYLWWKN